MKRNEGSDSVSRLRASSADSWTTCHRQAWFEYHPPEGVVVKEDRFQTLTQEFAEAHEKSVLASLGEYVTAKDAAHTKALMAQKERFTSWSTTLWAGLKPKCMPPNI